MQPYIDNKTISFFFFFKKLYNSKVKYWFIFQSKVKFMDIVIVHSN